MNGIRYRHLVSNLLIAAALTLAVAALDWAGYLSHFEDFLNDQRELYCQRHMPPPTDRLVHLDIDDTAVTEIGRWPWPRDVQAEILDELRQAGPKLLATDILYSEPSEMGYDARLNRTIDRDQRFADSIRQFGKVLIPCSLSFEPSSVSSRLESAISGLLDSDLEMSSERCIQQLRAQGFTGAVADDAGQIFLAVRPEVMYERIHRELARHAYDSASLKRLLLSHSDSDATSVLDRLFEEEYARVCREREIERFTIAPIPGVANVVRGSRATPPILPISRASAYSAFVDYLPDSSDGVVRSVPLVANFRGGWLPHMGLAAACAMLDVDVHQLRFTRDSVIIPRPGHDIVIPVSTRKGTLIGDVGMLMQVPMFGRRNGWLTMYDYPSHRQTAQHISVYEVWRACQTRRRIAHNESVADSALVAALSSLDPTAAQTYSASPLTGEPKSKLIRETLASLHESIAGLAGETSLDPDTRKLLDQWKTSERQLQSVMRQREPLQLQLEQLRTGLRTRLGGRALFLGGTATGIGDTKSTSLHYSAPGVVVHGAVFNAIMTGKLWRVAPAWLTTTLTIAMGLFTGLIAAGMSPVKGTVAAAALLVDYLAFNGYVLFDSKNFIVGAAGPTLAVGLAWSAVALRNFVAEIAERSRITRRFRSYVDPTLVDWVLNHPEQSRFEGEVREMTMVFTDLAGFTTMTERLGERAVSLLGEYMSHMVPCIRRNRGYICKQMGDGIFFFFNAPEPNPDQAVHAVRAVLEMRAALDSFNAALRQRDLPELGMRAGVSTGRVVIGDAGTPEASDYTALGDSVNLAARMESANKNFGTHTLITARTVELLEGKFLVRPIANLRVAGKTQGVPVFEPLAPMDVATPEQIRCTEVTAALVNAYQQADFNACLSAVAELEALCGPSKLTLLYRKHCEANLREPQANFDGQIVLTEK